MNQKIPIQLLPNKIYNTIMRLLIRYEGLVFWIVILGLLALKIAIPFFNQNELDIWDTSSHHQAVWFVKTYLFPHYTGWNPFAFAGYPQNLFYPPLVHYVGGALGQIMPVSVSLKILILLPLFLTPIFVYVYSRALNLAPIQAKIIVVYYLIATALFDSSVGGTYKATFETGLIVNNFGLMLFFLFLYCLQTKKVTGSILTFALIILAHLPTALAASLAFVAYFLMNWKTWWKQMLYIFIGTFLLTSFWTIPFLVFKQEMTIHYLSGYAGKMFQLLITLLFAMYVVKNYLKNEAYKIFAIPLLILVYSFILMYVPSSNVHVYRLANFAYWFLPFALYFIKKAFQFEYKRIFLYFILVIYSCFILFHSISVGSYYRYSYTLPEKLQAARVLTTYQVMYPPHMPHYFNDIIPMISGNTPASGLFMEGSLNSRYILYLLYKLSDKNFVWGLDASGFMRNSRLSLDKDALFHAFHINHLLVIKLPADVYPGEEVVDRLPNPLGTGVNSEYAFTLQRVAYSLLVEPIPDYKAVQGSLTDWKKEVDTWFFTSPLPPTLIHHSKEEGDKKVTVSPVAVTLKGVSETQHYLKFQVNAKKEVPVLIKISYFPKWRAFSGGKEIPIYRASPNMMVVFAKGTVEMIYSDTYWEIWLRYVSVFSLLGILVIKFIQLRKERISQKI